MNRNQIATVLVVLLASMSSYAGECNGIGEPGNIGDCFSCAPEIIQGNVAATDRILKDLSNSKNFANAGRFRAVVAQISKQKDARVRMSAYLALADVNAANPTEVAHFVGERSVPEAQLAALARSTNLDRTQAAVVIESLDRGLRGSLQ
jgi:hypothetical protein